MLVTDSCKNVLEKSSQPQTAAKFPKKEFLQVLRRAGISEETVKLADELLHDPVDQKKDGIFLLTHGLDRDQLINRMGGSP